MVGNSISISIFLFFFYLKILTYSEEYEDLFELKLDTTASDDNAGGGSNKLKSTWDLLRINYHPPWPLHLLFTPPIMEKYVFLLLV